MADAASATLAKIEALLRVAENRNLGLLEYAEGDVRLCVAFAGTAAAQEILPEQALRPSSRSTGDGDAQIIVSPGVGFLRCSYPTGGTLPGEGDEISAGAVVALVQAGPLFQPVTAHRDGRLVRRLVAEGAGVGFGTALFEFA